jgi:phosphoribosylamine--glycine ligase
MAMATDVLVLGAGAREHALCWKLKQDPAVGRLFAAPGNPGISRLATLLELPPTDGPAVVEACRAHGIGLVVVGPEAPLVAGVADALQRAGIDVFGPTAAAAQLEGSKAFAKEIMRAAGVPTADFRLFTDASEAEAWAGTRGAVVIKADGLAAGKGVVVAGSAEEAVAGVRACAALGEAGATLLLEERLEGEELSVMALCDGERYALLPPARDHKRVGDGDTGPNTGGMGAVCPAAALDGAALEEVGRKIMGPTLAEMKRRGIPFRGVLYAGLMLTQSGPKVLEFNCRFGDPEAQVILLMLDEPLLPLLLACARGNLSPRPLRTRQGVAVGVVAAAAGYPASPRTGDEIHGLEAVAGGVQVFQAGTKKAGGRVVTSGGRVLTACAVGEDVPAAQRTAYAALSRVRFDGMHYRRDIGASLVRDPDA